MAKYSFIKVRLMQSSDSSLSPGILGFCFPMNDNYLCIVWENRVIQFVQDLWIDSFHAEPVMRGCRVLVVQDVLDICTGNIEEILKIKDNQKIACIYKEFEQYRPLIERVGRNRL